MGIQQGLKKQNIETSTPFQWFLLFKLLHLIRLPINFFYKLVFLHQNVYLIEGYIHTESKLQSPQIKVNKAGSQEIYCSTTVTFAKLISVVE